MQVEHFLERSAARWPEKTALICAERRLTYREVDEQSTRLAALLQAHGVGRGDRVAIALDNSVEAVVAVFGALAAALVGIAHYYEPHGDSLDRFTMGVLGLEVLLGSLAFTGSLVAFGKLQELIPSSIKGLPNQNIINFSLLGAAILCCLWLVFNPGHYIVFVLLILLALVFGVCLVMPDRDGA